MTIAKTYTQSKLYEQQYKTSYILPMRQFHQCKDYPKYAELDVCIELCPKMSPNRCNAQCTAQSVPITYDPIRAIFIRSCNGGRRSPTVAFREQLLHFITFSFCHIESPRHITSCCTILACVASNNFFCMKYILKKF